MLVAMRAIKQVAWWEVRTPLGVVDLTVFRLSDSSDTSVISISKFRVNDYHLSEYLDVHLKLLIQQPRQGFFRILENLPDSAGFSGAEVVAFGQVGTPQYSHLLPGSVV